MSKIIYKTLIINYSLKLKINIFKVILKIIYKTLIINHTLKLKINIFKSNFKNILQNIDH